MLLYAGVVGKTVEPGSIIILKGLVRHTVLFICMGKKICSTFVKHGQLPPHHGAKINPAVILDVIGRNNVRCIRPAALHKIGKVNEERIARKR